MTMPITLYKTEKQSLKRCYYTGTDELKAGYALCYDRDRGTASAADGTRIGYVEKPSLANMKHFAGIVDGSGGGRTGPCHVDIIQPTKGGIVCTVFSQANATIDSTPVTVIPASYILGHDGEGMRVGTYLQTADKSSTNGILQALITGVDPTELMVAEAVPSSTVRTASPVIWGGCPWDALERGAADGHVYFNDYLGPIDVTTGDGWVLTQVDTKGALISNATIDGGALDVDSEGDSADDGLNAQLTNCLFKAAAGRKIWFEARVQMDDATQQYYLGLAAVDTTLIASGVLDDVSDKCGFFHHAASTDDKISSVTARAAAEDITADVGDNADATAVNLGFVIDGLTSVKFYVNGVLVETGVTVANIPNAVMCLSYVAQYEGAQGIMSVDWVRIAQQNS